jgi:hypothetical protein
MVGYNCFIIFQYYFMNYYLTIYHSKILKILSKQVNLCLYRGISANPILRKISDSWYTNFENFIILKIVENFEFFWNFDFLLKFYEIFEILNFFENFDFFEILWPPYPWNIEPMIFWSSLPMVFWPPYPWYFDTPTHGILNSYHGILTPLPCVGVQYTMGGGVKISWVGVSKYQG